MSFRCGISCEPIVQCMFRSNDLVEQNNLLHKHLESVSSQATRIRQAADSTTSTGVAESDTGGSSDTKIAEMHTVVAYIRKEKEIVDIQLDLSKQENTRLKSQIDHLQQSLAEMRRTLFEVRFFAVYVGFEIYCTRD